MTEPRSATPQGPGADGHLKMQKEIAAEAAVWIARLHRPDRDRKMEQQFREWQAQSPQHREAFEYMTDIWIDVGKIKAADAFRAADAARVADAAKTRRLGSSARRWFTTAGVTGAVALASVLVVQWRNEGLYTTEVGEQRTVFLKDGSRLRLNTSTRLRVDLEADKRIVNISSGEAFFDVAKDPKRPFVVRVAGSEVVAVGTAFSVRYAPDSPKAADDLVVTLVEGQVNVRPAKDKGDELAPDRTVAMKAGDRLLLDRLAPGSAGTVTRVDRPNVTQVTSWKRSRLEFDDVPLPAAVAEMNRYTRTPIVLLDGLATSDLHVSGSFQISIADSFADSLAALHRLDVKRLPGRVELSRPH